MIPGYFLEAVKLATANPYMNRNNQAAQLSLRTNPRDLGILSAQTGDSYRGVAYGNAVPGILAGSFAVGAGTHLTTGRTPLQWARAAADPNSLDSLPDQPNQPLVEKVRSLGTAEGRAQALQRARAAVSDPGSTALAAAKAVDPSRSRTVTPWGQIAQMQPKARALAIRSRLRAAGRSGAGSAAVLGGATVLGNMASYDMARTLAPKPYRLQKAQGSK